MLKVFYRVNMDIVKGYVEENPVEINISCSSTSCN
jgi:hypothetical protein